MSCTERIACVEKMILAVTDECQITNKNVPTIDFSEMHPMQRLSTPPPDDAPRTKYFRSSMRRVSDDAHVFKRCRWSWHRSSKSVPLIGMPSILSSIRKSRAPSLWFSKTTISPIVGSPDKSTATHAPLWMWGSIVFPVYRRSAVVPKTFHVRKKMNAGKHERAAAQKVGEFWLFRCL